MRTILRVATFQTTVFGALPVAATRRPSWLHASESTEPNGPRSSPRAAWSRARHSVTRPGAGEVANSQPSGLTATAVEAFAPARGRLRRDRDGVEAERPAEAPLAEHVPDDLAAVAGARVERRRRRG